VKGKIKMERKEKVRKVTYMVSDRKKMWWKEMKGS